MEASVERVVGWLQRTALWLAGVRMLLQSRTIRNKLNSIEPCFHIFVATGQQNPDAVSGCEAMG